MSTVMKSLTTQVGDYTGRSCDYTGRSCGTPNPNFPRSDLGTIQRPQPEGDPRAGVFGFLKGETNTKQKNILVSCCYYSLIYLS